MASINNAMISDAARQSDCSVGHEASYKRIAITAAIGVFIVLIYGFAFGYYTSPLMGDAASYIEAARSFLRGEPLLLPVYSGKTPMYLWPPGLPVLGGIVSLFGLPAQDALLWVTRGALAMCLPAAYWALAPALGTWPAVLTGILCITAPGLLSDANQVSSDAVFALLCLLALGSLMRERLVATGLMVGLALCVRNSALALGCAIFITTLLDNSGLRDLLARLTRLVLGGTVPVVSLLLWNVLALGTLSPYSMPPSTRGLVTNLWDMSNALMFDFVPFHSASHLLPWYVSIGIISICCIGVISIGVLRSLPDRNLRRLCVFAGTYILLGLTMTVVARTRYEWCGDSCIISVRHASQYDWLMLPIAVIILATLCPVSRGWTIVTYSTITLVIMALRTAEAADRLLFYQRTAANVASIVETGRIPASGPQPQLRQMFLAYEQIGQLDSIAREISPDCRIFSNLYDLLVARYGVAAFQMPRSLPMDRPAVAVIAAVPAGTAPAFSLDESLLPADIRNLPASLHLYSNAPSTCVRKH
jgi:hypothetical protein